MACDLQRALSVRRRGQQGFTLIEMSVVVVIVGILATLAVVGYRKIVVASHTAEATHMVQAIRVAQEAYKAETQVYADISPDLNTTYPAATPLSTFKTVWGAACASQCNAAPKPDWSQLPVHIDGPVMFGYATTAGVAGTAVKPTKVTVNGADVTFPATAAVDWFVIGARVDSTSPANSVYCHVYGSSFTNDIYVDQEGE